MENIIQLNHENIDKEHICCAISDKKTVDGYNLKKDWLKKEFDNGYVFRRLNERAKVFIEYGPTETGWVPLEAPNYLLINCFWVSGKYKKQGYGKKLMQLALEDAEREGKSGLVTVVGTKKFHFMSDGKWLLKQGFQEVEKTETGFSLLVKTIDSNVPLPKFKESVLLTELPSEKGLVAYYSNRCPFTELYAGKLLKDTAEKRNLPLEIIKLETVEQAQNCPSPATIFSLFQDGKFITTDVSVCMDSRFDKILEKANK